MYAPEGLAASTGSGYPSFSLPLFLPHSSFPLYSFPFETLIIPLLFFSMISHLALSPLNVTNPGLLSDLLCVCCARRPISEERVLKAVLLDVNYHAHTSLWPGHPG